MQGREERLVRPEGIVRAPLAVVFLARSDAAINSPALSRGILVGRHSLRHNRDRPPGNLERDPIASLQVSFAPDARRHGDFGLWLKGDGHGN